MRFAFPNIKTRPTDADRFVEWGMTVAELGSPHPPAPARTSRRHQRRAENIRAMVRLLENVPARIVTLPVDITEPVNTVVSPLASVHSPAHAVAKGMQDVVKELDMGGVSYPHLPGPDSQTQLGGINPSLS